LRRVINKSLGIYEYETDLAAQKQRLNWRFFSQEKGFTGTDRVYLLQASRSLSLSLSPTLFLAAFAPTDNSYDLRVTSLCLSLLVRLLLLIGEKV
jgi:hypothetical protein